VWLWHAASGRPIGPILKHLGSVNDLALSPDGKSILAGWTPQLLLRAPEVPDDLNRAANWVELVTGMTLDPRHGSIQLLDNAAWLASRERLEQAGGPPLPPMASPVTPESRPPGLAHALARVRLQKALDQNNAAWTLATSSDPKLRDPARAVELASKAVRLAPANASYQNTLGTALYRLGDWSGAIHALRMSNELDARSGLGVNAYFLAMAHLCRGEPAAARVWFDIAGRWHHRRALADLELRRFRTEAVGVLGLSPEAEPNEEHAPDDNATLARLVLQADPTAVWARTWLAESGAGRDRPSAPSADAAMPNGPEAFVRP